jgi:DNA-binding transcriptional LysR family regulator
VAIGWRTWWMGWWSKGCCAGHWREFALERGYYAVLPPRKRRGALIERFVDWLEQERSL